MKYFLIVYKEDSDDYCKGCFMEHYNSYHDIIECENEEELVEKMSDFRLRNLSLNYGEMEYEMTIKGEFYFEADSMENNLDIYDKVNIRVEEKIKEAKEEEKRKKEEEKQRKIKEKEEAARQKELKDKKEYERLKAKYKEYGE